jgi:hypothetical protein
MTAAPHSEANSGVVEIVQCQLCGSRERRTKLLDGPFTVFECAACEFVYVSPRLSGEAP